MGDAHSFVTDCTIAAINSQHVVQTFSINQKAPNMASIPGLCECDKENSCWLVMALSGTKEKQNIAKRL